MGRVHPSYANDEYDVLGQGAVRAGSDIIVPQYELRGLYKLAVTRADWEQFAGEAIALLNDNQRFLSHQDKEQLHKLNDRYFRQE
jgi:hypothetical protein